VKIQAGNVAMSSRRSYEKTKAVSSSLSRWGGGFLQNQNIQAVSRYSEKSNSGKSRSRNANQSDSGLFDEFKQAQSIGSPVSLTGRSNSDRHTIRAQTLNYLFMILMGEGNVMRRSLFGGVIGQSAFGGTVMGGSYTEREYESETEETSFSTEGTVKTADGREISFNVSVTMSRSFEKAYEKSIQFAPKIETRLNLCDPLVINLTTDSANVTDQKFYFDLDADGVSDEISMLAPGSGFLALDKNGDGIINDGSELFGTKSGDGFKDLAAYDEDGNGWIDENDPIFDKLRIWTKDAFGKDVLCAIGKAGIGAIYLGNADTDFSLNSKKDNSTNALIRKTGIFLYENGACGTVQHLDLVKSSGPPSQASSGLFSAVRNPKTV